jgi:phospholipase/carboxylesterase
MVMPAWYDIMNVAGLHQANTEDIIESCRQLEALMQAEIQKGLPPERIILAGFSQGGTIALYTGLRYEKKLAGIMALSTYLPAADQPSDAYSAANRNISIFMAHGTGDPMIQIGKAVETRDALKRLAYNIHWKEYPMEHSVCYEEIQHIRSWIMAVLA